MFKIKENLKNKEEEDQKRGTFYFPLCFGEVLGWNQHKCVMQWKTHTISQ